MKVTLRPLDESDLEQMFKWRNDPEIRARTRQWRPLFWREHVKWFENLDMDRNLMLAIVQKNQAGRIPEKVFVGVCGLAHIDWVNRHAEVSIYIGDKQNQSKGVGQETIRKLKEIAFDSMDLNCIWAEVYGFNKVGIEFFKKCNFHFDGLLRQRVYRKGKFWDSCYYSYIKKDWVDEK